MAINAHHSEFAHPPHQLVMANLIRAQQSLPRDPDLAALYLDGVLRDALALAQGDADFAPDSPEAALGDLDAQRPLLARRLRLALRAPNVAARLAHAWDLLELLNADPAPVPASNLAHLRG